MLVLKEYERQEAIPLGLPMADVSPSMSNTRAMKERVRTYQPQLLAQIIQDSPSLPPPAYDERFQSAAEASASLSSSLWERSMAQRQAKDAIRRAREEVWNQAAQTQKRAADDAKDAAFQRDYDSVLQGIVCSSGDGSHIMGETQGVLDHKQKIKNNKQAALYDEWSTEVFDKIQGRLQHAVDKRTDKDILARLQSQMGEYLHTTNTKLGVFRDVIIEEDYDPMKAHQHDIRVFTGDIRDPVKRDVLKPVYERAMMGVASAADSLPLGKQTLDTKMWGDLAIHSTPYGHNVDPTGNNVLVPMSERAIAGRKSRIPMDHYDFPTNDNQAAAEEMGRPGKRTGIEGTTRARKDLYDVVQQTCGLRPDFTGGDSWLEAKGKGAAPGPEKRRGRPDLTEILHQASNPYQDGRTLGDQWLEAKGKAMPPGPEVRRGRADLSEIVQQSSNPYVDKRSLGDQWLEARGKAPAPAPKETVREFLFRSDCPPDQARVTHGATSCLINDKTLQPNKGPLLQ